MGQNYQEIEVKFYIADLPAVAARLSALPARLLQPRTHEINLRFDTPTGELLREMRVLRLRQDTQAHLTYKGPGQIVEGTRLRQEIELVVSDFAAARALLEALGYQVVMMYEKYRAAYAYQEAEISLDEMPYGNFVEIEAADPAHIRSVANRLGLTWEARVLDSYTALFESLRRRRGYTFRDLSFENFAGLVVTAADLEIRPADAA